MNASFPFHPRIDAFLSALPENAERPITPDNVSSALVELPTTVSELTFAEQHELRQVWFALYSSFKPDARDAMLSYFGWNQVGVQLDQSMARLAAQAQPHLQSLVSLARRLPQTPNRGMPKLLRAMDSQAQDLRELVERATPIAEQILVPREGEGFPRVRVSRLKGELEMFRELLKEQSHGAENAGLSRDAQLGLWVAAGGIVSSSQSVWPTLRNPLGSN